MSVEKTNLLNLDRPALEAFFAELGEKPFRAAQLMKWIYHHGVDDFDQMTNISKVLREKLKQHAEVVLPEIVADQPSDDGSHKWALRLPDGNRVETVFIPDGHRGTVCVSSQVGCALACSFCSTARQGFNRNLSAAEIVGQVLAAQRAIGVPAHPGERVITNVVMMGMGEPLLNLDEVIPAMEVMQEDNAFGISKRKVTLSTAGVVPAIDRLGEHSEVSLAVSLHAPNDDLRDELVPLNKRYPIRELLDACRRYIKDKPHRKVTFEYTMLAGVNDTPEHARKLLKLMRGLPSKVNLIPFNTFPDSPYESSSMDAIDRFRDILVHGGVVTITRKTRGDDIDAACGQLVGKVQDRTRRSRRFAIREVHA